VVADVENGTMRKKRRSRHRTEQEKTGGWAQKKVQEQGGDGQTSTPTTSDKSVKVTDLTEYRQRGKLQRGWDVKTAWTTRGKEESSRFRERLDKLRTPVGRKGEG